MPKTVCPGNLLHKLAGLPPRCDATKQRRPIWSWHLIGTPLGPPIELRASHLAVSSSRRLARLGHLGCRVGQMAHFETARRVTSREKVQEARLAAWQSDCTLCRYGSSDFDLRTSRYCLPGYDTNFRLDFSGGRCAASRKRRDDATANRRTRCECYAAHAGDDHSVL